MFTIDTVTLFAFFGTFQGLIFAVIFWHKNKSIANRLFAFLLLATSIRIAKNIFVHLRDLNPGMFSNHGLWQDIVYIGITHQLAIGPLFFIYFQSKLLPKFKIESKLYLHFLPYVIFLVTSLFVNWSFWQNGGLYACYASILFYYLLSLRVYYLHQNIIDVGTRSWLGGLLITVGVLMTAYSPILFHYVGYAGGGLLYTIAILVTGYVMISSKGNISFFRTKYETSSLSDSKIKEIRAKLEEHILENKPYLNVELTLNELAIQIEVQPHHLSRVINQNFKASFTDYINQFRLTEAIERLGNPQYDHLKIAALAYECGFNSVPTFNNLFKKVYKSTPSAYRNKIRSD